MSTRILRLPDVLTRTGLSRSTVYQRITEGAFPASISLGDRAVGWVEADIEEWLAQRIEQSRVTAAPCAADDSIETHVCGPTE